MKHWFSFMLFCTVFLLAACSLGEEDIYNYSGIISNESALGYEYTVTKENDTFTWVVRHKENIRIIEETVDNQENLQRFMYAVSDSHAGLATLIIWIMYLLFIIAISFYFLHNKGRKNAKDYAVIIIIFIAISLYLVVNAVIDLTTAYQSMKHYYFTLIN